MEIISFFAGILLVYTRAYIVLCLTAVACWFYSPYRIISFLIVGCLWAWGHEALTQGEGMPEQPLIRHALLQGIVTTIPKVSAEKTQFQFEVTQYAGQKAHTLIWMRCYAACPKLHVGETWRFKSTLKKPKKHHLPSEMDIQSWMKSNHIEWFGVVESGSSKRLQSADKRFWIQILREKYAFQLEKLMHNKETLGLIQGLTLGVATHIDAAQWALFRRTGTTHLVVISGEHIALIAGAVFILFKKSGGFFPLIAERIPLQRLAAILAFIVAFFYAHLSGLGAPVERALVAFSVILLRYFLPMRFSIWQAWRMAMATILCIEPHVVLTTGFYLSFLAVAILVVTSLRFPARRLWQMVILQGACLIGLLPLTLYLFSYGSLMGFFVNLLSIPLVGLCIVPVSLLGLLISQIYPWSGWLWVSEVTSHWFLHILAFFDTFSWTNITYPIASSVSLISILLGIILWVVMPIRKLYFLYAVLIGSGVWASPYTIKPGEAIITLFDVGQGLSVLVKTAHHTLLYDTGGRFFKGEGDFAKSVILPYLQYLQVKSLDAVVISHPDLDHRGGLETIAQSIPVGQLWVNDPRYFKKGSSCHHVIPFEYDGVEFTFFPLPFQKKRNDTSCVLQVKTAFGSVLLTGDIESSAENALVWRYGPALQSTVLIVPHHGSKTSSSLVFLNYVQPKIALNSSGLNNQYHFPHQKTRNTYRHQHIPWYDTAICGSISLILKRKIDIFNTIC